MAVKIGKIMPIPMLVTGWYPQGSILGFFLFNRTIDDLGEGSNNVVDYSVGVDGGEEEDEEAESSGPVLSTPVRPEVHRTDTLKSPLVRRRKASVRLNYSMKMRQEIPYCQSLRVHAHSCSYMYMHADLS